MRRSLRPCVIALFALCMALLACGSKQKRARGSVTLPALAASSWLLSLPVPGYGAARVALPLGAREPRPLVLAIHGALDRPEWQCGSYRGIAGGRSFILCPQGDAREPSGFTLGSPEDTESELRAAISALKARFSAHVARGPVVLSALGPGVDHALALALAEPSFFSHLVLVNGSLARLTPAFATRFGHAGGKRVLCVCSAGGCDADAERRVQSLRPAGVDARLIAAERGQGLDAEVAQTLKRHWAWLVSSDPRWR